MATSELVISGLPGAGMNFYGSLFTSNYYYWPSTNEYRVLPPDGWGKDYCVLKDGFFQPSSQYDTHKNGVSIVLDHECGEDFIPDISLYYEDGDLDYVSLLGWLKNKLLRVYHDPLAYTYTMGGKDWDLRVPKNYKLIKEFVDRYYSDLGNGTINPLSRIVYEYFLNADAYTKESFNRHVYNGWINDARGQYRIMFSEYNKNYKKGKVVFNCSQFMRGDYSSLPSYWSHLKTDIHNYHQLNNRLIDKIERSFEAKFL